MFDTNNEQIPPRCTTVRCLMVFSWNFWKICSDSDTFHSTAIIHNMIHMLSGHINTILKYINFITVERLSNIWTCHSQNNPLSTKRINREEPNRIIEHNAYLAERTVCTGVSIGHNLAAKRVCIGEKIKNKRISNSFSFLNHSLQTH